MPKLLHNNAVLGFMSGYLRQAGEMTAQQQLLMKLKAYWKMDEVSGARFDSKNGFDLTDINTVNFDSLGVINNASRFISANTELLSHPDNSTFSPTTNSFCIAGWVKPNDVGSDMIVISKNQTLSILEYELRYSPSTESLIMLCYPTVGSVVNTSAGGVELGEWSFFVGGFDATLQKTVLSVNGQPYVQSIPSISDIKDTAGAFKIGFDVPFSSRVPLDGSIDEVGFYCDVLTQDEIDYLWNGGKGRTYPLGEADGGLGAFTNGFTDGFGH